MKHNNAVESNHKRKDWARWIRTWLDQPARKSSRRAARISKARAVAPRPTSMLRPVARCPTIRYNRKVRAGRGFTVAELKAANINVHEAASIGICVDHRRKNRSEEHFNVQVDRLKEYMSKVVIFPRKSTSKRVKKGDSSVEDCKNAVQVTSKDVIAINRKVAAPAPRAITAAERKANVSAILRKAHTDNVKYGKRVLREKKAEEKKAKK